MDRGSRIGTADRRAAGPAHSPRPHPGDERRKLPSETEQTQAGLPAELLIRPLPASTAGRHPPRQTRLGEEDVFRCGLNAPPFRRRRPPLQTPSSPTIPNLLPVALVYWSTFTPPLWSAFIPPLTFWHIRVRDREIRAVEQQIIIVLHVDQIFVFLDVMLF